MSKTDGRVGKTTNVIIGGTVADDSTKEWLELDQKVSPFLFLFCQFLVELFFYFFAFRYYVLVFMKAL